MSRSTGSPKKKRPKKSHKSEAGSEMDRDAAWKTARLAAILSTRVPLARSVDVPAWDEGPTEAEEAMELIGHQRQDGIYMSCLRRARFLLEAAEGAGRVHAADLFEEKSAYRMADIVDRFHSVGWLKLQRDVSIGKLIGDIGQEARRRLKQIEPGQIFSGNIVEERELSEIDSIIQRREDPPKVIQFGLLLKLCERHGLLYDPLTVERRKLVDPPAPRYHHPGEWSSDALQIHRIFKILEVGGTRKYWDGKVGFSHYIKTKKKKCYDRNIEGVQGVCGKRKLD